MKNLKKAVILMLSIFIILTFANYSLARTITNTNSTNNTSNSSEDNNNTDNDTDNDIDNSTGSNTANEAPSVITNNTPKTINSSNVSENLPNTGVSSAELNLALILLLTLVFGMFSLVQYNKIVKKDNEE